MIIPIALAVAFALGVDPRRVALLALASYLPLVVAGLLALLLWRSRGDDEHQSSVFCESVAAELRAGSTLRSALEVSARSVGVETPSASSAPISDLARSISSLFPTVDEELRLTIVAAATSGSDVASLFDEIGSLALAQSEIEREVRVATAPGRATAILLVGAPLIYVMAQAMSGELEKMLASPHQRIVALLGLGLFVAGLAGAALVIWRSSR